MTGDEAMERIHEILYPSFDFEHEWSSNELEWIAEVVNAWKKSKP